MAWALALGVALGTAIGARPASAQATEADRLYAEGTQLLDAGEFDRACPMLAESHRLDPAAGALLALARCHEKAGRLATAWSTYGEAAALARRRGDTAREVAAKNQLDVIGPRIPRLVVRLEGWERLRDVVVHRNGVPLAPAEIGTPIAVDPGMVVIEAHAAGRLPRRREVRAVEAQTTDVTLPAPERPVGDAAGGAAPSRDEGMDGPPVASWIAAGVGLAGLGVFAGFGLASSSAASEVEAGCPDLRCPESLRETVEAGERDQLIANVGLGVGIAGLATAGVLWAVWPDDEAVTAAAAPGDGPGAAIAVRF